MILCKLEYYESVDVMCKLRDFNKLVDSVCKLRYGNKSVDSSFICSCISDLRDSNESVNDYMLTDILKSIYGWYLFTE